MTSPESPSEEGGISEYEMRFLRPDADPEDFYHVTADELTAVLEKATSTGIKELPIGSNKPLMIHDTLDDGSKGIARLINRGLEDVWSEERLRKTLDEIHDVEKHYLTHKPELEKLSEKYRQEQGRTD